MVQPGKDLGSPPHFNRKMKAEKLHGEKRSAPPSALKNHRLVLEVAPTRLATQHALARLIGHAKKRARALIPECRLGVGRATFGSRELVVVVGREGSVVGGSERCRSWARGRLCWCGSASRGAVGARVDIHAVRIGSEVVGESLAARGRACWGDTEWCCWYRCRSGAPRSWEGGDVRRAARGRRGSEKARVGRSAASRGGRVGGALARD